ncbi:two-component system nitrate/nitrite sensor histidine kinase NarX [Oxalobacteraceae bacterium GrIS 1.11]
MHPFSPVSRSSSHPSKRRAERRPDPLAALCDITALLAGQHAIDALCRAFLRKVMDYAGADGGTVRMLDSRHGQVHIVVHEGISEALIEQEHCIKSDACLCGAALAQGVIVVKDFRQMPPARRYRCQEQGFVSLAVLPIEVGGVAIGSYSLHFARHRALAAAELRLLTALGQNLGIAIDNQRLIAREKEYAVEQERSLLAQGLHDSIAQGLNLLNLQVQMLDAAVRRDSLADAARLVPLLRAGVEESYADVRELLRNFRSRWDGDDVDVKLRAVLQKFEEQSGVGCSIEIEGCGAPLAPEQQLQVLFILQEALSNIRKHARAGAVSVRVENGRDFALLVRDDGCGFAPALLADDDSHVGLAIMRERAVRLGARLEIASAPGAGTTISLQLRREGRLVA